MGKRKTTVYLDEDTLRSMRVFASRAGKRDSEVVEEAIREHLGIGVLERVWARSELDEDEALELAYEAVHQVRSREEAPAPDLSRAELEVLALLAFGLDNEEVADRLRISRNEVVDARASALEKLRLGNVASPIRETPQPGGR